MDLDPNFNNHFLLQLFSCKDKLNLTLNEMLENIFNIYDYNGDGVLDKDEYLTFISDILYISVLMKRIEEKDYTLDIVIKISNWSSSNFKTNLFRIPNERIHHDNFLNGILHALTETKESSIFPQSSIHTNSFVPELMHYFDYYIQLANRRGWPTELLPDEPEIIITEQPIVESETKEEKETEQEKETEEPIADTTLQNTIQPTITPEQQMSDYRERQKQKMKEKKDKEEQEAQAKEQERQRVIQERHNQEDLVQQQLYAQQQQQAAQFQERQRQLQQQELQERQRQIQLRILQQQLQNIQRLQHQFREHLRQKHLQQNQEVDQLGEGEPTLECAGPLEIDPTAEGFEVIEGNVNVVRYIEEDKEDRVAFRVGDSYYLASKTQIRSMINQGEKGNSLFYGCLCEIEDDWTLPTTWALLEHTVITNTLYFNIQQLGLPIRYLDLKDVMKVLNGTDNYFLIEKPKEEMVFPSFASDDILNHGIGSMSGSHCQDGQTDIVYIIKRYEGCAVHL